MKVIAAIDNSPAARPVLSAANAAARFFAADVEALHIREGSFETARADAQAAGVQLRVIEGPVLDRLVAAARDTEVVAMVVGRGTASGGRPAGRMALRLVASLRKPLLLIPTDCEAPVTFRCFLLPLEATSGTAAALERVMEMAHAAQLEVVVLHIQDETTLPMFSDQAHHEFDVWTGEFLRRYTPRPEEAHIVLRAGVPAEHVLPVCAEVGADLIALGWSRSLASDRAPLVKSVLEGSRVPVLLLPLRRTGIPRPSTARTSRH